jgi:hypothetical protein
MCCTIKRTLKNETSMDTMMKFYETMAIKEWLIWLLNMIHDIQGQKSIVHFRYASLGQVTEVRQD